MCSLDCAQLPAGRQKEMWVYFGHEASGFVVSEQTGRGGCVCFPWLSVWRCFYSKADCTVSGCLYTISIIKEEEQPLPHASPPPVWRPLSASQSVTFFFLSSLLRLTVFHQVFLSTGELSLFLTAPFICLIHSFIPLHDGGCVGGEISRYVCIRDICVCVCIYLCMCALVNLQRWADVMLSVFVTHPGSSRSQEFYKRKWQNVDATACRRIWNSALGWRKLWNYGWRVFHHTL